MKKKILVWITLNLVLALFHYLTIITGQSWFILANVYFCIEFCTNIFTLFVFGGSLLFLEQVKKYQIQNKTFEKNKQAVSNISSKLIPKYLSIPLEITWIVALFNYNFVFGATVVSINFALLLLLRKMLKSYKKRMFDIKAELVTNSQK